MKPSFAAIVFASLALFQQAAFASAPWIAGVRFTVKTEGPIRGTPVVNAGRVYFGSSDKTFYAVDAKTGRIVWRFATRGAITSSAATDGKRVYFSSRDSTLYAVDAANGALAWSHRFGADLGSHNFWDYKLSSPALSAGAVIAGGGDGTVISVDAASGRLRWRFDAGARVRSTPAVAQGIVVVGTLSGHVIALRESDGREAWRFATQGSAHNFDEGNNDATSIVASPTIVGQRVFVGSRDSYLYALGLHDGKPLWRITHDESSWILGTVSDGERLYVGSGSAQIVQAVDPATGAEAWRSDTAAAVFSSLSLSGETLLHSDFAGNVEGLDRHTGALLWRIPLGGRSFSTPVESGGIVYCASDRGVLYALDVSQQAPDGAAPPRRIVYVAGKKSAQAFTWLQNGIDTAIAAQLKAAGYESLDTEALAALMQSYRTGGPRTVVVLADGRLPPELTSPVEGVPLVRRFLDAGGKVVLLGPNPLAFKTDPATGAVTGLDYSVPQRVFDVPYAPLQDIGGYFAAEPTAEGRRMGLRTPYVGYPALTPDEHVTPLALDEYGKASAWLRGYGGAPGMGLMQLPVPRQELTDLAELQAALEYGVTW